MSRPSAISDSRPAACVKSATTGRAPRAAKKMVPSTATPRLAFNCCADSSMLAAEPTS